MNSASTSVDVVPPSRTFSWSSWSSWSSWNSSGSLFANNNSKFIISGAPVRAPIRDPDINHLDYIEFCLLQKKIMSRVALKMCIVFCGFSVCSTIYSVFVFINVMMYSLVGGNPLDEYFLKAKSHSFKNSYLELEVFANCIINGLMSYCYAEL